MSLQVKNYQEASQEGVKPFPAKDKNYKNLPIKVKMPLRNWENTPSNQKNRPKKYKVLLLLVITNIYQKTTKLYTIKIN